MRGSARNVYGFSSAVPVVATTHPPGLEAELALAPDMVDKAVDAIIFGHSHVAMNAVREGILYFNPGSPNDKSAASCSYGILTVEKKISGRIIKLS